MRTLLLAISLPLLVASRASGDIANDSVDSVDSPRPRPNILLIMVDDLGWMDLACQGNRRLTTPHIDRLAREGRRFTDAYAAAPVCSPSRAAVLTGLAPARLHITNHIPDQKRFIPDNAKLLPAAMLDHLPVERVTIAERLREAGYATGFFGKWHLAGERRPQLQGQGDLRFYPERQGFDVNLGGCAMGGPFSFFDPFQLHNLPPRKTGQYMPDRYADEVIQYMSQFKAAGAGAPKRPFFICLWNYVVHWPMEAPAGLIEKYRQRSDLGRLDPRYAAMIEALDASIGRILHALEEQGQASNTLIVFTSDNGAFDGVADNQPLRAAKGYLYEGGIRVPLIVRWPGVVPAGGVSATPVIGMDFHPTLLEAARLPLPETPLDGISLAPWLWGAEIAAAEAPRPLFFHYPNYAFHRSNRLGGAVRLGDWKLIENFDDQSVELYHLRDDVGEQRELAAEHPARAREMLALLRDWRVRVGAAMPTAAAQ